MDGCSNEVVVIRGAVGREPGNDPDSEPDCTLKTGAVVGTTCRRLASNSPSGRDGGNRRGMRTAETEVGVPSEAEMRRGVRTGVV